MFGYTAYVPDATVRHVFNHLGVQSGRMDVVARELRSGGTVSRDCVS